MPWPTFERVINALAGREYQGWLAFHNYNEPLANPRLLEEVRFASCRLPRARLTIFSNGDYLSAELFEALATAGLAQLRLTVYPPQAERGQPSHQSLRKWLAARVYLPQTDWRETTSRRGPTLERDGRPSMLLISPDVDRYYDRGGIVASLSVESRQTPCTLTSHSLSIDYEGNVKMCCNIVARYAPHEPYVVGNAGAVDIVDLWNGVRFAELRRRHLSADWSLSPVCHTCRQELLA